MKAPRDGSGRGEAWLAAERAELIALLTRPDLPDVFARWTVVIEPGRERATAAEEWVGALVLVHGGDLEVVCGVGGVVRFGDGEVMVLGALPLIALRNPGDGAVSLTAVRPTRAGAPTEGLRLVRGGHSSHQASSVTSPDVVGARTDHPDPSPARRLMRMTDPSELRGRFRALHAEGTFVMPNAWDVGSARLLAHLGFPAIATTSSGFAATLGRSDQRLTRDECIAHADVVARSSSVPVNVDAERCYADDLAGVGETVDLLGRTAAAGVSIEDYDPSAGRIDPLGTAVDRVAAVVEAARPHGLVVTARAENHLYGIDDLEDTIDRLRAYREAGADVVYAPGPRRSATIATILRAVDAPHNVLLRPGGPGVDELRALGVRRISTGGALAFTAYGAAVSAARALLEGGGIDDRSSLGQEDRDGAFDLR